MSHLQPRSQGLLLVQNGGRFSDRHFERGEGPGDEVVASLIIFDTVLYQIDIGTHGVRELFCSCQEEVRKWLLNERACTKVHYWDVVYLSSVEHSKSIGF